MDSEEKLKKYRNLYRDLKDELRALRLWSKALEVQHLNEKLSQKQMIETLQDELETLQDELRRALASLQLADAALKSYRIPTGVPMNMHENMSTQNAYVVGAS